MMVSPGNSLPTIADVHMAINNGVKLSDQQAQVIARELAVIVNPDTCECGFCIPVGAVARFGNGEGVSSEALIDELTVAIAQTADVKALSRIAAFTLWLANEVDC